MLTYVTTSLFDSPAQTLVNAVNTVGVMGKGVAAEFKKRYPTMYETYRRSCKEGTLTVGKLQLHRSADKWILNFPTKEHWRSPSKLEWIELGLKKFAATYQTQGITSTAFPMLGCGSGQLDWEEVRPLMESHLSPLSISVFVHIVNGPNHR